MHKVVVLEGDHFYIIQICSVLPLADGAILIVNPCKLMFSSRDRISISRPIHLSVPCGNKIAIHKQRQAVCVFGILAADLKPKADGLVLFHIHIGSDLALSHTIDLFVPVLTGIGGFCIVTFHNPFIEAIIRHGKCIKFKRSTRDIERLIEGCCVHRFSPFHIRRNGHQLHLWQMGNLVTRQSGRVGGCCRSRNADE